METTVELESGEAGKLRQVLEPSLRSGQKVGYRLERDGDTLEIQVRTGSLGPLRGATDTVFRLSMLSNRILTR
ncbi:MAG: KEOPS complex subunit Pcc1 [Candidatus Nanohaloarchaea archaeon]